MLSKLGRTTILISLCALVAGLGLFAYMGFFNRYWADDWCYNRDFKYLGFAGTMNGYFFTGAEALRGYSTNRYTLTLLSGALYEAGMFGTEILATLIIAAWFVGLLWVLANLREVEGAPALATSALGAAFLLYYAIFLSPQRFQTVYWRSGVHYSITIICGLYLMGLVTAEVSRERPSRAAAFVIVPLAFLGGGLSEIGAAYLVCGIGLLWLATWYASKGHAIWAERSYRVTSLALISLLASVAALILSPSNSRAAQLNTQSTSWAVVPLLSLRFAVDFVVDSFKSLPLPHLVLAAVFLSLSLLSGHLRPPTSPRVSVKTAALCLLGIGVVVTLLLVAIQAPNVRFYSAPPAPRAQSLSRFTMLAGIALAAWITGQAIVQRWKREWIGLVAVLGIALGALYTVRLIAGTYAEIPGFQQRAQLWDQRDADVQAAIAAGQKQVSVSVIDTHSISVRDILRSSDMTGEWVSNCGSQYYGLSAIRANRP